MTRTFKDLFRTFFSSLLVLYSYGFLGVRTLSPLFKMTRQQIFPYEKKCIALFVSVREEIYDDKSLPPKTSDI